MKRRWLSFLAALVLMVSLAVPAMAAQNDNGHFAAYYISYDSYEEESGGSLMPIIVAAGISGIICFGLVSLQKNVHKKSGAADYITEQGVNITHASDRFTHTTQTRRKLQTNQNQRRR